MPTESTHAGAEVLIEERLENRHTADETPLPSRVPPAQDELNQLRLHLQFARQQVQQAEHCVESSLTLLRTTPSNPGIAALASPVDELSARLDQLEPKFSALVKQSHQILNSRLKRIEETLATLSSSGSAARKAMDDQVATQQDPVAKNVLVTDANRMSVPETPSTSLASIAPVAMFGIELMNDTRTEATLVELTQRLINNDPAAVGLAGQLMSWRSAARERIPKLLGDVGDAYYACFPRTNDDVAPLEQALMEILERKCIESEVPNSIELVRLGERFDPSRHRLRAGDRGTEVTEIHGWIVVGSGGQVLNRAQVGVK